MIYLALARAAVKLTFEPRRAQNSRQQHADYILTRETHFARVDVFRARALRILIYIAFADARIRSEAARILLLFTLE